MTTAANAYTSAHTRHACSTQTEKYGCIPEPRRGRLPSPAVDGPEAAATPEAVEAIRFKEDQRTHAQKAADLATKVAEEAEVAVETAKQEAEKKIKAASAARAALATVSEDEAR